MTRTWPAVATAALLAALVAAPASQAAFPGRNSQIAYVNSSHSGPEDWDPEGPTLSSIELIAGSLLGADRFTLRGCSRIDEVPQDPGCATSFDSPAYSPDGDFLAVDAGARLAILSSDGRDFHLLPRQTVDDGEPAWSPDGRRIVFTGVSPGSTGVDLYVLNVAKGTSRRLTNGGARAPAWSTRNRIAFVTGYSQVTGQPVRGQLATIKPDGSGRRRLTRKGGLAPSWSPHGSKIAFVRKGYLYVMNANGKGLRRVRGRRPISADDVAWSPNGRLLAYHAFESGIFVVRTDGTRERSFAEGAVSANSGYDSYAPDWRPLPPGR